MVTTLMVLAVVIPGLGGVLAGATGRRTGRAVAVAAAGLTALAGVGAAAVAGGSTHSVTLGDLPWLGGTVPVLGLCLDPIGSVLLVVLTVIGLLTVLFSFSYVGPGNREHAVGEEDYGRYYFWLLLFMAAMAGVALAANLLVLFAFWEMTTVCSWALIGFYRDERSLRASFKALVMTHVGGVFLLAALLLVFVSTGSFEFSALAALGPARRMTALMLVMVAAWAKAAQVPVHTWLPDAMSAPTPVSAYLHAAAMVKAGVFLMARVVAALPDVPPLAAWVLGGGAMVTIFLALSYYFAQDDLKRLLAYSTIAHLGYVLLGVAVGALGSLRGLRGGVLHIACHGFSKATLFLCVGAVAYVTGSRRISELGGVARSMPLTATAFFVGVLATTGVPPFACFWSKLMILTGAVALGGVLGPLLAALILVESLVSFAWMAHIGQRVFFGPLTPVAAVHSDPPPAMSAALLVLSAGCLAAPALAMPFVEWIGR